jgi:hypothetical protein
MIKKNEESVGYLFGIEKAFVQAKPALEIVMSGNFNGIPPEIKQHVTDIIGALAKKFNGSNAIIVGRSDVGQISAKVIVSKASISKLKPIFRSFNFISYVFLGGSATITKGEKQDRGSYGIHFKYQGKGTTVQNMDISVVYDANIPSSSTKWAVNFL